MAKVAMKRLGGIVACLAGLLSCAAGATLEECSSRFGTNIPIVWQAPTNLIPQQLWVYRFMPQVFSAAAISNGIVLAGFEKKGVPKLSMQDVVLWADRMEGEPRPPYFAIYPKMGQMSFTLGDRAPDSPQDIARDAAAVKRALTCAALLGVAPADLAPTNAASAGLYGVFLARQIDGVRFFNDTEGLQVQFGKDGKIRQFCLLWPKLVRDRSCPAASVSEIIRCFRRGKIILYPTEGERNYFARVQELQRAKKLTITRIQVYYGEGTLGEDLPNNEPPRYVSPVAELDGVADFGTSRVAVRFLSPALSSDVKKLLEKDHGKSTAAKGNENEQKRQITTNRPARGHQ